MGITIKREKSLGEVSTGRGRSVKFRLVEYDRGGARFDVRGWFVDDGGQSIPTGKGVGIRPEHIAELRKALDALEAEAGPAPK